MSTFEGPNRSAFSPIVAAEGNAGSGVGVGGTGVGVGGTGVAVGCGAGVFVVIGWEITVVGVAAGGRVGVADGAVVAVAEGAAVAVSAAGSVGVAVAAGRVAVADGVMVFAAAVALGLAADSVGVLVGDGSSLEEPPHATSMALARPATTMGASFVAKSFMCDSFGWAE